MNSIFSHRCRRIIGTLSVAVLVGLSVFVCRIGVAAERILEPKLRHLRNVEPREWNEFPTAAEATQLVYSLTVTPDDRPRTLRLRHRDLKQRWSLELDDRPLATLPPDENDATTFWSLPEDLAVGEHQLRILTKSGTADDVLIGEIVVSSRTRAEWLGEASVEAAVVDATGDPLPCRLTVVTAGGSLMTCEASNAAGVAVRPGVVYTADGRARIRLPAGTYTLYAGRGFEYSLASQSLVLQAGHAVRVPLKLVREVPTEGWVSCDTHVHTLSLSGHGDATADERMLTLAGEGIELPIATEHNRQVDYRPYAERLGVVRYFSPVVGNEVTTRVGHFNVFPLSPTAAPIEHRGNDWAEVSAAIRAAGGEPVVVLNHARDIHSGFRPFDRRRHNSLAGEDYAGWPLPARAMEVVNSGATQTDPWQLFHDWLGLLNRGLSITPIGASDSHDVTRYIVGQGRTYVQVDDRDPGRIDVAEATRAIREGRVMAGMGLLCRATVNRRFGPGLLADASAEYQVDVDVLGPSWVDVSETRLYVNGRPWTSAPEETTADLPLGVRRRLRWTLPRLKQDAHVVALARGPGVTGLFWPIAKAYQPASPEWESYVIGCSGAIRIDADGDGRFTSPGDYARRVLESTDDVATLLERLEPFDEATAVQAASLLRQRGGDRWEQLVESASAASPHVRSGILAYFEAWKASQIP